MTDGEISWGHLIALGATATAVQIVVGLLAGDLTGGFRIGSVDEAVGVVKSWLTSSVVITVAN